MGNSETEQWENAEKIAKYLVDEKGLKSPNMLFNPRDVPLLEDALNALGMEDLIGTRYSEIMGKVNPKLCDYWAKK